MTHTSPAPNHHRDHPGFAGVSGLLAAMSMSVGRDGDARFAAQTADLGPGDVVVDIGCGPGVAARLAAARGATVTGVDPSAVMLRTARVLTRRGNVRYESGAAEELPVRDGSATVVWSIASVHHWPDLDAALGEIRRVLRPGGRFVTIERRTQPGATGLAGHGWTDDQAAAFVKLCGAHAFAHIDLAYDEQPRRRLVAVHARAS
jgi:ubiquinone/menaquinone biosynthesis C-methylase UbiE